TTRDVGRLVSLEHLEHLEEAERLQRGVVLITALLGYWELGAAVLTALGRKISAVYFPQRTNKINELFQKHRSQRGIHLIPFGQAARGVLRALKNREHVAMLADRDYTTRPDDPILFFGRPARLPSSPARIAIKTGAPVLPVFLVRQPDDTFRFRFHTPLIPTPSITVADMRLLIRDAMESEIRRQPLQWFMFDDFWQTRSTP
ncbi:MAG: lysophospholipid acyltransferase family protein, partial [Lentisphaerae bacterium]|nr:lysophospholipid acyltransferase family protein [Lentisphaerota bacterium]